MNFGVFDLVPIYGIYIGVTLLILLSFEIGFQIGEHTRSRYDKDAPISLGPMVGGLLGMLGFVLAFTYSMAASQHDLRKQYVLDEANVVGTAYLRADLLDEQHQKELKRLLREYVDVRLQGARDENLKAAITRSVELHDLLWIQASSVAKTAPSTNTSLVIQAINEVIDMHEKRVSAGVRNRIPGSIWIALFIISTLTMITMGTQVGLTGKRRLVAIIPLALAFAALATVVVDLDRPQQGLITVSQQAMVDLQESMNSGTK